MSKYLLLTLDFPPKTGGVARYLYSLATYLEDQITVVAPESSDSLYYSWFWPRWLKSFFILKAKKDQYEIFITSHIHPFGLVALLQKLIYKKPFIVILHGLDLQLAKRNNWKFFLTTLILKNAQHIIANTKWVADEIYDMSHREATVVYPTPSKEFIQESKKFIRSCEHKEHCQLLMVARLVKRKGHSVLLKVLSELKNDFPNIHLNIVGSGPEEQSIRNEVRLLGLDSIVKIYTKVSDKDLMNYYKQADLFLMPVVFDKIDREGFGIVYLEAAAFEVPVIATNLPGIDEAVEDGKTGILLKDQNELRGAIIELIENPTKRIEMGRCGKVRVQEDFVSEAQWKKAKL